MTTISLKINDDGTFMVSTQETAGEMMTLQEAIQAVSQAAQAASPAQPEAQAAEEEQAMMGAYQG